MPKKDINMNRNELRLEFTKTSNIISDDDDLQGKHKAFYLDWCKCDPYTGERGIYKDEYVLFLEDKILKSDKSID